MHLVKFGQYFYNTEASERAGIVRVTYDSNLVPTVRRKYKIEDSEREIFHPHEVTVIGNNQAIVLGKYLASISLD